MGRNKTMNKGNDSAQECRHVSRWGLWREVLILSLYSLLWLVVGILCGWYSAMWWST